MCILISFFSINFLSFVSVWVDEKEREIVEIEKEREEKVFPSAFGV